METKQNEETIVSGLYDGYVDTQKEILSTEIKKTRNKLFTIAAVIFCFDLLAIMASGVSVADSIIYISVIPLVMAGLAFLSLKEPILAMIIATIIIVGLWVYMAVATSGKAAISGWLGKALLVYLILAGFQNAREAQKIKKELKG